MSTSLFHPSSWGHHLHVIISPTYNVVPLICPYSSFGFYLSLRGFSATNLPWNFVLTTLCQIYQFFSSFPRRRGFFLFPLRVMMMRAPSGDEWTGFHKNTLICLNPWVILRSIKKIYKLLFHWWCTKSILYVTHIFYFF